MRDSTPLNPLKRLSGTLFFKPKQTKQIKHGLEGNKQVYGLVGQTEEGI